MLRPSYDGPYGNSGTTTTVYGCPSWVNECERFATCKAATAVAPVRRRWGLQISSVTVASASRTPGTGQVEWDATFAALKEIGYDGWIVIEAFGDALPDLAAATKIWRRMFESEEQLARDGAAFIRDRWGSVAA